MPRAAGRGPTSTGSGAEERTGRGPPGTVRPMSAVPGAAPPPLWWVPRAIRQSASAVAAGLVFVAFTVDADDLVLQPGAVEVADGVITWVGDPRLEPRARGTDVRTLGGVLMLLCAWRWYLVPYVALTDERLVVQGVFGRHSVRYSSIRDVRPCLYGLRIRAKAQESLVGWAVQKSKFGEWSHRETMADEVTAAIMARVRDAPRRRHHA